MPVIRKWSKSAKYAWITGGQSLTNAIRQHSFTYTQLFSYKYSKTTDHVPNTWTYICLPFWCGRCQTVKGPRRRPLGTPPLISFDNNTPKAWMVDPQDLMLVDRWSDQLPFTCINKISIHLHQYWRLRSGKKQQSILTEKLPLTNKPHTISTHAKSRFKSLVLINYIYICDTIML